MVKLEANKVANKFCNIEIDYSKGSEGKFPYRVALDLTRSVLEPAAGQKQRFSYRITATQCGCLSRLRGILFDICDSILSAELAKVTVEADGSGKLTVFEDGAPLPPGGLMCEVAANPCADAVRIHVELVKAKPVGMVEVWLFRDGARSEPLELCGPVCAEEFICPLRCGRR